jgi:hypothetical protein
MARRQGYPLFDYEPDTLPTEEELEIERQMNERPTLFDLGGKIVSGVGGILGNIRLPAGVFPTRGSGIISSLLGKQTKGDIDPSRLNYPMTFPVADSSIPPEQKWWQERLLSGDTRKWDEENFPVIRPPTGKQPPTNLAGYGSTESLEGSGLTEEEFWKKYNEGGGASITGRTPQTEEEFWKIYNQSGQTSITGGTDLDKFPDELPDELPVIKVPSGELSSTKLVGGGGTDEPEGRGLTAVDKVIQVNPAIVTLTSEDIKERQLAHHETIISNAQRRSAEITDLLANPKLTDTARAALASEQQALEDRIAASLKALQIMQESDVQKTPEELEAAQNNAARIIYEALLESGVESLSQADILAVLQGFPEFSDDIIGWHTVAAEEKSKTEKSATMAGILYPMFTKLGIGDDVMTQEQLADMLNTLPPETMTSIIDLMVDGAEATATGKARHEQAIRINPDSTVKPEDLEHLTTSEWELELASMIETQSTKALEISAKAERTRKGTSRYNQYKFFYEQANMPVPEGLTAEDFGNMGVEVWQTFLESIGVNVQNEAKVKGVAVLLGITEEQARGLSDANITAWAAKNAASAADNAKWKRMLRQHQLDKELLEIQRKMRRGPWSSPGGFIAMRQRVEV